MFSTMGQTNVLRLAQIKVMYYCSETLNGMKHVNQSNSMNQSNIIFNISLKMKGTNEHSIYPKHYDEKDW